jgi:dihydroorotate dehydrogenase (NAD+) catalytic subunit
MTAAGPTSRDGNALKAAAKGGVGGLVAKTISVSPAVVPRPCIAVAYRARKNLALLDYETRSDIHYQRWIKSEYQIAKSTELPVFASIGYTVNDI